MDTPSRTPEGQPSRCHVCGKPLRIDPSNHPFSDATCPRCGALVLLNSTGSPDLSHWEIYRQSLSQLDPNSFSERRSLSKLMQQAAARKSAKNAR
jgi:hypothetical protein